MEYQYHYEDEYYTLLPSASARARGYAALPPSVMPTTLTPHATRFTFDTYACYAGTLMPR